MWDALVAARGAGIVKPDGALGGPFGVWVHAPGVGARLAELGTAVRYGTSLAPRLQEVATVTVAAHWKSEYEWYAHARIAAERGVPAAVLDAIADDADPPFDSDGDRIIHTAVRNLLRAGIVDDSSYAALTDLLSQAGVVELIALCGYYTALSFTLNAFQVDLPHGVRSRWT